MQLGCGSRFLTSRAPIKVISRGTAILLFLVLAFVVFCLRRILLDYLDWKRDSELHIWHFIGDRNREGFKSAKSPPKSLRKLSWALVGRLLLMLAAFLAYTLISQAL